VRTCIGCRARKSQAELVRVTRQGDGTLRLGNTLPGRGAWLCQGRLDCFDTAVGRRAFAKALRADVTTAQLERLRTDFAPSGPPARD
jgi:predicted RNA-binding protein YlxR (DUF448 family)